MASLTGVQPLQDQPTTKTKISKIMEKPALAAHKVTDFVKDIPKRMTQTYRDMPANEPTFTFGSVPHNRKAGVKDTRDELEREDARQRRFSLIEMQPRNPASLPPPGGDPIGPSYVPNPTNRWRKMSNRFFYGATDGADDGEDSSAQLVPIQETTPAMTQPPTPVEQAPPLPRIRVEEVRDEDIEMPFHPAVSNMNGQRSASCPLPTKTRDGAAESTLSHYDLNTQSAGNPDLASDEGLVAVPSTTAAIPPVPPPTPTSTQDSLAVPVPTPQETQVNLPAEPVEPVMVTANKRRMRRVRSAMLRKPILKAMLGAQLAGVVKPALVHLGEGGTLGIHEVPSQEAASPILP